MSSQQRPTVAPPALAAAPQAELAVRLAELAACLAELAEPTAAPPALPAAPSRLAVCLVELRHHARGSIGYTAKRAPSACPHRGQAEPPAGGAPRGSGWRESMSGCGSRTSSLAAMPAHGVDPAYRNSAPGSTLLVAVEQQKSSTCSCGRQNKNTMC